MADSKYMLEMKWISKSFPGLKALDGVQLKVRPGTVYALIGKNGHEDAVIRSEYSIKTLVNEDLNTIDNLKDNYLKTAHIKVNKM